MAEIPIIPTIKVPVTKIASTVVFPGSRVSLDRAKRDAKITVAITSSSNSF